MSELLWTITLIVALLGPSVVILIVMRLGHKQDMKRDELFLIELQTLREMRKNMEAYREQLKKRERDE